MSDACIDNTGTNKLIPKVNTTSDIKAYLLACKSARLRSKPPKQMLVMLISSKIIAGTDVRRIWKNCPNELKNNLNVSAFTIPLLLIIC